MKRMNMAHCRRMKDTKERLTQKLGPCHTRQQRALQSPRQPMMWYERGIKEQICSALRPSQWRVVTPVTSPQTILSVPLSFAQEGYLSLSLWQSRDDTLTFFSTLVVGTKKGQLLRLSQSHNAKKKKNGKGGDVSSLSAAPAGVVWFRQTATTAVGTAFRK